MAVTWLTLSIQMFTEVPGRGTVGAAVAPLSVLVVGMVGLAVIAFAVVRIAVLERRHVVAEPAPLAPAPTDTDPWALPGSVAA